MTNCSQHTKNVRPVGYIQVHAWAEKKSKRHYQVQCDECGRWAIWKRKPKMDDINKAIMGRFVVEYVPKDDKFILREHTQNGTLNSTIQIRGAEISDVEDILYRSRVRRAVLKG